MFTIQIKQLTCSYTIYKYSKGKPYNISDSEQRMDAGELENTAVCMIQRMDVCELKYCSKFSEHRFGKSTLSKWLIDKHKHL